MEISKNKEFFIQAAGVRSSKEAKMLVDCGFTHLGFPHFLPVNKEDTTLDGSKEIIASIKNIATPVLITYQSKATEIMCTLDFLNVFCVQLHGSIKVNEIDKLKENWTDILIIKSLIIKDDSIEDALLQIENYQDHVDSFITDTYDPSTGAEGATGKTHDWEISKKIVELSEKPVILAGGLNPNNLEGAIKLVKPAGVDVHTGIEDERGNKDKTKATQFCKICRERL